MKRAVVLWMEGGHRLHGGCLVGGGDRVLDPLRAPEHQLDLGRAGGAGHPLDQELRDLRRDQLPCHHCFADSVFERNKIKIALQDFGEKNANGINSVCC